MKTAIEIWSEETEDIIRNGLWKAERVITSPQGAVLDTAGRRRVINLCSNDYLGLANDPDIIDAARQSYSNWGAGTASVRFICGTMRVHKELEQAVSAFIETEDTMLFSSCFEANTGLFESLLCERDIVFSDELNHASLIDGMRLCKARVSRYKNGDMASLERFLMESGGARIRMIATDGVFSMDGNIADLKTICDLACRYDAVVLVDDSHGVGVLGERGRGTHEHCGVLGRVDLFTGTFGKALGGAGGGYISGKKGIIDLLRQRSRPYLFSNALSPAIAQAAIKAIDIVKDDTKRLARLCENAAYFKQGLQDAGFDIAPGVHPISPVMLKDGVLAQKAAERLLTKRVYAVGFAYPVVPKGRARIRTQVSALHSKQELDFAVGAFADVKHELGL